MIWVYDKTLDLVISLRLRVVSNKCPRAPQHPALVLQKVPTEGS